MKIKAKNIYYLIFLIFTAFVSISFYLQPAANIASGSGTVLSDNWWEALNWIKNNTPECSVVTTYWDPGHFITAIAKRPVIFDGASQNSLFVRDIEGNLSQDEINSLAPTGKYEVEKKEINSTIHTIITTARIQDVATSLFTSNETLAYDIIKNYNKPGCNEMYYIASADLIGKANWWTYFATWNPVDKGTAYNYLIASLAQAKPLLQQNAIAYTYPFSQQSAFIIYDNNGTLQPFLQDGNQFLRVEKLFFFSNSGVPLMITDPEAPVKGLLWLDPSRQTIIFMLPELENSMFTTMFFFNGIGLNKFEFVRNFGGEVKLFRIKI